MTVRSSVVLLLSIGLSLTPLRVSAQTAAPAAAPADDKAANMKRAEELFRNGERLYTEGSYEPAILAFQESYELSKEPSLLYNIGNSYERLGDFANARRYLDQYRAFASEKEREPLARRIQALDQRQREKEDRSVRPPPRPKTSRAPTCSRSTPRRPSPRRKSSPRRTASTGPARSP